MPLVFFVLVVIVIFVNISESSKSSARASAVREKNMRKTNARMEVNLVDMYMKYGYSFGDAISAAYEDLAVAGYEPCVPRSAYADTAYNEQTSKLRPATNRESYDSYNVKSRREQAQSEWKMEHPGKAIDFNAEEEIDRMTYAGFPSTEYEYLRDLKKQSVKINTIPVGEILIYPGLGTCEVVGYTSLSEGYLNGYYKLKVLSTGEIITYVKIGDKKISRI